MNIATTVLLLLAVPTLQTGGRHKRGPLRRTAGKFPKNTTLGVLLDIVVPVVPMVKTTGTYLTFDIPLSMYVPTAYNLNALYTSVGRRLDDEDIEALEEVLANQERRKIYQYVEGVMQNFGLDGTICVQRAICELAESSLASHGLFGQAFHIIFEPTRPRMSQVDQLLNDTDLKAELDSTGVTPDDDYVNAHSIGKLHGECYKHFPGCSFSPFKLLHLY